MNKYLLIIPTLVFVISCGKVGQKELDHFKKYGVKGKIRYIKNTNYLIKEEFGEIVKAKVKDPDIAFLRMDNEEIYFSNSGLIDSIRENGSDDKYYYTTKYTYLKSGKLNTKTKIYPNGDIGSYDSTWFNQSEYPILHKEKYFIGFWYAPELHLREQKINYSGEEVRSFEIDVSGKTVDTLETMTYYLTNDTIYPKTIYRYKSNTKRKEFKYDQRYNLVEEVSYNKNGDIDGKHIMKYNDNNKISLLKQYLANGKDYIERSYVYDENDRLSEVYNNDSDNNDNFLEEKYEYDDKGHLLALEIFLEDGKLLNSWQFKYEFDQHGNWIKRITFNNNIPYLITESTIKY